MSDLMETLLEMAKGQAEKAKSYAGELRGSHTFEDMFGRMCISMTISFEILRNYKYVWDMTPYTDIEQTKRKHGTSIMLVHRMTFIEMMSAIEFFFKEYIAENPEKVGTLNKRASLKELLELLREKTFLSEQNHEKWDGLRELRNAIVHNDGNPRVCQSHEYKKATLELKEGIVVESNLLLFPNIMDWMLDQTRGIALGLL